jgi:hypothetical protein
VGLQEQIGRENNWAFARRGCCCSYTSLAAGAESATERTPRSIPDKATARFHAWVVTRHQGSKVGPFLAGMSWNGWYDRVVSGEKDTAYHPCAGVQKYSLTGS